MERCHAVWGCAAMLVILVLLALPAFAVNESDIFTSTPDVAGITPPSIPGGLPGAGAQKPTGASGAGGLASAPETPSDFPIALTLLDAGNRSKIGKVHVIVIIRNGTKESKTLAYVSDEGILNLRMPKGKVSLVLKVDDITTPGGDYYATDDFDINGPSETTILLFPVGSVRGTVKADGSLVAGAKVNADCSGMYGDILVGKTDDFGSFSAQWLPLGTCTIQASDGKRAGSAKVDITPGGLVTVDIPLLTRISSVDILIVYVAIGFIVLISVAIVLMHVRRRQPKSQEAAPAKRAGSRIRLTDIMATLSPKEKQVVSLLEKDGEVTQAKIIYTLMVPKTTLVRLLQGLEAKNIVSVKKFGKAKKVVLTDWILEKK